jgi:hypothetical protein
VVTAAIALVVYLRTLLPGIAFGDWGEMQVQPTILGIAHPTGYPTYLLMAHALELVPIGSVAFRANFLSAVFTALTLAVAVLIAVRLGVRPAVAAVAALALGAIGTVWSAATVAEVNPLHLLFGALIIHRALVWRDRHRARDLGLGALLVGLAIGNHLLTLTFAPFIVVYVAWTGRRELLARPSLVVLAVVCLVAGLAVYLYIPIRAAQDPPLTYNHPKTFDAAMWLISGRQFRDQFDFLSPKGPERFVATLPDLVSLACARATPLVPFLAVAGLLILARRRPTEALMLAATLVVGVYVWANYLRLEHYLLVAWLVVAIGAAVALEFIASRVRAALGKRGDSTARHRWATVLVTAAGGVLAVVVAAGSFPAADRSTEHAGNTYVDTVFATLAPDSVMFSQWDTSTPLWYGRFVDGRRPDVTIMDDSNIVYDGWGTRERAIAAFVCTRPVFILLLNERELEPIRAMYDVEPVVEVPVGGGGGPTAVTTRRLYRVRATPEAC